MSRLKEMKSELRSVMKTVLEKVSTEETKRQSEAVCGKVINSKWFKDSKRVSVYVSTTGEIQTDSIILSALETGKEVFIPQFRKGSISMEMVRVIDQSSFNSLPITLWGIRQPDFKWKWEDYNSSGPLDLILTPGVAFTPEGLRCGHGKGYYDRFFIEHSEKFRDSKIPLKVGLALREQIVKNVPIGDTDVKLDQIICEGNEITPEK